MCVKSKSASSPRHVHDSKPPYNSLLRTSQLSQWSEREELLPAHFTPWAMRPHMKLAQYSHQWGPRKVWTWKRGDKVTRGEPHRWDVSCQSTCIQTSSLSTEEAWYDYIGKTLVEWHWQAVQVSFRVWFLLCLRNGDKSNQYFIIYSWKQFLQCSFPTVPYSCKQPHLYVIQIVAFSEHYGMKKDRLNAEYVWVL